MVEQSSEIMVSIVCNTYNHERYIADALEGFVTQKTNFAFEILVHDDASTDRTAEIIREYEKRYPDLIKPIYQTKNQYSQEESLPDRIQLSRVKGKYIALCEGDDYWNDDTKLQRQYEAMEQHPECSICTSRVRGCNEDGTPNKESVPPPVYGLDGFTGVLDREQFADLLWKKGGYPFHTCSYFVRTADCINADKELNVYLKREVGLLRGSLLNGGVYYIDDPLATWRLGSVNGWFSRLKASGKKGKVRLYKDSINMDIHFDVYTSGKYRRVILPNIVRSVFNLSLYSFKDGKQCFDEYVAKIGWTELIHGVKKIKLGHKKLIFLFMCQIMRHFPKVCQFDLFLYKKFTSNRKRVI